MRTVALLSAIAPLLSLLPVRAEPPAGPAPAVWPQWRGPTRDGVV